MIECNNLQIGYSKPINEPFNLTIEKNKWLGIIGENGVGKSTFFKTIIGDLKPLNGNITIDKLDLAKSNKLISYIPQERDINVNDKFSGYTLITLSYNGWNFGIPFIHKSLKQKSLELLELVGAINYMHQPFCTLSGGQKKRIYLAQALINNPSILLLDEPLADLDPNAKQHFVEALQEIHKQQKLTLLIISHDMHEIAMHLDGFIHFKKNKVHYCEELPCIKEAVYVGI